MTNLAGKFKTFFWYLARPKYYNQLLKLIRLRLFSSGEEKTRRVAAEWCRQNAVSTQEALRLIIGTTTVQRIEDMYAADFAAAKTREENCPVKMGGPGDLNLLYNLCEHAKAQKVIETGVAYGWSSFAILLSIAKRNGMLCSTDMPYPKMNNEDYVGIVVPDHLHSYWTLIRLPDDKGLKIALEKTGELDLCHYDSDKTYSGRMFGYRLLWNALKPGGIFVSDDINDNMGFHDFCEKNNLEPVIVEIYGKYVGIVVKK